MFASIKEWMIAAKDWVKANFRNYFWYFVVFVLGIIFGGLFK